VLSSVIAHNSSSPVPCRWLPLLVDNNAIMRYRLSIVIREMFPVVELLVPRPRIQRQKSFMINNEIQGIVMPMLLQYPTAREHAVRIILPCSASHNDLPHILEVSGLRQFLRHKRFRRIIKTPPTAGFNRNPALLGQQKWINEPATVVSLSWYQLLPVRPLSSSILRNSPATRCAATPARPANGGF